MNEDVILFRAYNPKTQQPVRVNPLPSRKANGKHYTGQGKTGFYENLTTKDKEELAIVITPETYITIHDGKALRLDDAIDASNWKWIQKHPYIAMDRVTGKSTNRDAVFYIENKAKEADVLITKDKLMTKAKSDMYDSNREKLDVVAKSLGHPSPMGFSEREVQKYILDIIDATPQVVIDSFNPDNQASINVRSLLADFVRHNIMVKSRGSYFYGGEHGTHIGRSEQEVVNFLMDDDNSGLVASMTSQLEEIVHESVSTNG